MFKNTLATYFWPISTKPVSEDTETKQRLKAKNDASFSDQGIL